MTSRAQTYAAISKLVASLDDPFTRFLVRGEERGSKGGRRGTTCCNNVLYAYERDSCGVAASRGTGRTPGDLPPPGRHCCA